MADNNNDEEFNTTFYIPQNYTEAGKAVGGMFETRNLVEAAMVFAIIGYLEFRFITLPTTAKAVIMLFTIFPPVILALTGIDGYPLSQYLENIIQYMKNKRKLHFRRVGYSYVQKTDNKKTTNGKVESKKDGKKTNKQKQTDTNETVDEQEE